MRFALGMDNREIARALGRTDGATKVLLHRAIRQLEELVKQGGGADHGEAEAERAAPGDFEHLLRQALQPVDPPDELEARVEQRAAHAGDRRRRGARGLGALRDARPAQLGPARSPPRASAPAPPSGSCSCGRSAAATSAAPPPRTCSSSRSTPSATSPARPARSSTRRRAGSDRDGGAPSR